MGKGVYQPTKRRLRHFRRLIEEYRPGETIPGEEVVARLERFEDGAFPERSDRPLKDLARLYSALDENDRICKVEYSRGDIVLLDVPKPAWQERQKKNSRQKRMISRRLLHWLFDQESVGYRKNDKGSNDPNFGELDDDGFDCNWTYGYEIHQSLNRKRAILRGRTRISLLVDAGTTNLALMTSLFSEGVNFPLRVYSHRESDRESRDDDSNRINFREVRLALTTNSIPIAHLVGKEESRESFSLQMIGGIENPARRSLVGETALGWIRSQKDRGIMDLSIVGTTGFRKNQSGLFSAYMDDELECELKSEFLDASSFRIIICDSSKILAGSCTNAFCNITSEKVDLIVTDDGTAHVTDRDDPFFGEENLVEDTIMNFGDYCRQQGVGMISVRPKKD